MKSFLVLLFAALVLTCTPAGAMHRGLPPGVSNALIIKHPTDDRYVYLCSMPMQEILGLDDDGEPVVSDTIHFDCVKIVKPLPETSQRCEALPPGPEGPIRCPRG